MLGGMLSGHDESGGDTIIDSTGKKFKLFYDMSSKHTQDQFNGGMYKYISSEGKVRKITYRVPVETTILDVMGGMRSTGTYRGARRLKDFPKCTTFL
jgi:GMP reductase